MDIVSVDELNNQHRITSPWSWISFMFSAFYFFSFFALPLTFHFVVVALFYYALFAAFYIRLTRCPQNQVVLTLTGMLILGIIASGHNPSSGVIFGYTTFFAGFYLKRAHALIALAIVCVCLFISAHIHDLWVTYYIFPSLIPAISMSFLGLYIQSTTRHAYQEQRNSEEKRQLIKVAERERIARDLHDTLGHTLSSITLKAQLAKKLGDNGQVEDALKEIHQVAQLARDSLSEVRSAISGYRKKGLTEELENLEQKLTAADFAVKIENSVTNVSAKIETALILILIESVTNIVRHSSGNTVEISLSSGDSEIDVSIKDNGHANNITLGNGLKGMQERVEDLAGSMDIDNNQGFSLHIMLPVITND
ncbi:sensor histidine kinase [Gilvimarinus sp. SDUM040013]|uniref:Sensor histidine kinase n=1 Tax=Gilvimarinus gilvus TaxID=3058038 RepID=A0ABU4RY50_9GAMM|nr:sensor histidine kinase [Gilvimarinus sp. SDUM040013]MDO3388694.1 sensor histidine kinase [Gilvimarinus sp. SDUM040013]MDX6849589.1 sensor histidine kinase [Gilvimarinus sp. SDUM040013]